MKKVIALCAVIILICSSVIVIAEESTFTSIVDSDGALYVIDSFINIIKKDSSATYDFCYKDLCELEMTQKNIEFIQGLFEYVEDSIKNENDQELSFKLYRLKEPITNKKHYAVECSFYDSKAFSSIKKYFDYEEIDNVIITLSLVKEYMEDKEGIPITHQIYYISPNGIIIRGGQEFGLSNRALRMSFDESMTILIKDIQQLDTVLNYFKNVENMIIVNEELKTVPE